MMAAVTFGGCDCAGVRIIHHRDGDENNADHHH
jgi:hypothetical protein